MGVYFCNSSGLLVFPHSFTPFPNCIALLTFEERRKNYFHNCPSRKWLTRKVARSTETGWNWVMPFAEKLRGSLVGVPGRCFCFTNTVLNNHQSPFTFPSPHLPHSAAWSSEKIALLASCCGNNRFGRCRFHFPTRESERWPDWIPPAKVMLWIQGWGEKSEENILHWYPMCPEHTGASPCCTVVCW